MSVRSSRSLLQLGAESLQSSSRIPRTQHRAFSASCSRLRYGPVPKFTNLSSPELETLLTSVRENIILPAHLTTIQRNLIYKSRNHKELLIDPITIKLGDESFTLKPIIRTTDIPAAGPSLFRALELMSTNEDYENIPRLLEGLRNARAKLVPNTSAKVTMKLGQKGQQHVILDCARRGEKTGFDLSDYELVRQVLWFFHSKAAVAEFDQDETKKALAWSEQIFELMQLPENCGKGIKGDQLDPRTQPLTVGVLLELAAVKAAKFQDGKDVDGKVEKYAKQLLATGVNIAEPSAHPKEKNFWLATVFPLVHGLKVAVEVLGSSSQVAQELKAAKDKLDRSVDVALKDYRAAQVSSGWQTSPTVESYEKLSAGSS